MDLPHYKNADCTTGTGSSDTEKLKQFDILVAEANTIREKDNIHIKGLFNNFYNKKLTVGIGYQRAYGSVLSGDYFDLIHLPDGNYLFIFADMSGHGLPAYTNLLRFRSAVNISITEARKIFEQSGSVEPDYLIKNITMKFTDIMEEANTHDFACVLFTFIYNDGDKFHLKFYNRSMLFPIIVRKFQKRVVDVYNLNREEKGWIPYKGNLLSNDVRTILGEKYIGTPPCTFTLYEGDTVLYFSDGIIEACRIEPHSEEFGEGRIIENLLQNINHEPQHAIDQLFAAVYAFIGCKEDHKDDMTAIMIDFPHV